MLPLHDPFSHLANVQDCPDRSFRGRPQSSPRRSGELHAIRIPEKNGHFCMNSPVVSDLVFDIGMHVGQDAAFYLAKGFRVVAIDANPMLCAQAGAQFADHVRNGQLTIVNVGVSREPGDLDFYVNDTHSEWSSFIPEVGSRLGKFHVERVRTAPLHELTAQYGCPYYAKIDIEGHDMIALESLMEAGCRPKFVSVENGFHPMVDLLAANGYSGFKFINQATVPQLRPPQPAREGQSIDYTFPFGSSGPFGEDTPGDWLSMKDIHEVVERYWTTPNLNAEVHGWFDLHARR